MPVNTQLWDYALWIGILIAEGWILGILLGRGAARRLPWFTGYIVLKLARSLGLFYIGLWCSTTIYFYTYWVTTLLVYLLTSFVIYELFDFTRLSYRRCLLVVLTGSLMLLLAEPINTIYPLIAAVRGVEKVYWLTMAGLFLWAVMFEPPVSRERYGIALGLAVFAGASMVKAMSIAHYDFAHIEQFKRIPNVIYPLTLGIWLYYLRAPRGDRWEVGSPVGYRRIALALESLEAEVGGSEG